MFCAHWQLTHTNTQSYVFREVHEILVRNWISTVHIPLGWFYKQISSAKLLYASFSSVLSVYSTCLVAKQNKSCIRKRKIVHRPKQISECQSIEIYIFDVECCERELFFAFVVFVFIYIRLLALTHSFVRNQFYSCDHCHERLSLSLQSKHVWFFFCLLFRHTIFSTWMIKSNAIFLLVPLDDLFAYDRNLEQGEK